MDRTTKGRETRVLGRKTTNSLQHSDCHSRGDSAGARFCQAPWTATLGSNDFGRVKTSIVHGYDGVAAIKKRYLQPFVVVMTPPSVSLKQTPSLRL